MQRMDASDLRRNLFKTIRHLDEPIEILRSGRVDAVLIPPPPAPEAPVALQFEPKRLARICQKHGIQKMALFGSVARGDCGPDSDVDVLIELTPKRKIRLRLHVRIIHALADIFGREVDLHYFKGLDRADATTRAAVVRDMKVIYAT